MLSRGLDKKSSQKKSENLSDYAEFSWKSVSVVKPELFSSLVYSVKMPVICSGNWQQD